MGKNELDAMVDEGWLRAVDLIIVPGSITRFMMRAEKNGMPMSSKDYAIAIGLDAAKIGALALPVISYLVS